MDLIEYGIAALLYFHMKIINNYMSEEINLTNYDPEIADDAQVIAFEINVISANPKRTAEKTFSSFEIKKLRKQHKKFLQERATKITAPLIDNSDVTEPVINEVLVTPEQEIVIVQEETKPEESPIISDEELKRKDDMRRRRVLGF